ncbi:hypothetical protein JMJ55_17490 [Belnapia sp. T6]|uniref:Uncharacterized protein n=1 Tax=Belnapia mucosa TaxID=2804532 RepID=A0ABS1V9X0_9PROT|nr:hypothetical protein [Belnapia mucosa]MBL6457133.1 hypothetical protein [Belnapia mucosa]
MIRPVTDQRIEARRLDERRRRAAEHRWRCYDFGHDIVSYGEWTQHGRDGGHWRRPVRLRAGRGELAVTFAVTFAVNTNHMIEAYAETITDPPLLVGQWSDDERRAPQWMM